ncbi:cytochrome c3 family protein [Geopsychrobacter electrodiphilus]|uniref:cytochrome c3 family protein n=1 Tax=Geopsychrobacter electrodiphilus TaxID=225196 RepID=UPI00146DC7F4|nr:cytochrome c3 family protein [Geopsychrobacter electrodiphilus]
MTTIHTPFWERRCVVCHLEDGVSWSAGRSVAAKASINGKLVDQGDMWRKLQTYSQSAGPVMDHLIKIPDLEISAAYRLRIVVSSQDRTAGGKNHQSLWLGLKPNEISEPGGAAQLRTRDGLTSSISAFVKEITLARKNSTIEASWATAQPLYGWVELQPLAGLSLTKLDVNPSTSADLSATRKQHSLLRNSEDLAINACYQCHPESSLGTSHPVRLYGGKDVRIPEELPTVNGMLTCVTCHDPHGSAGKMLVRETIKTKLCVACHYIFKNSSKSTMFN